MEDTIKQDTPPKKVKLQDLKKMVRLYGFIKPYRRNFILGLFFLLLSSGTSLLFPKYAGMLIDAAQGKTSLGVKEITGILFVVLVFQSVFSYFRIYLFAQVTEKSTADIRFKLYARLMGLHMSYFDKHRTGELNSRLSNDVTQLQDTLGTTLAEFIRQVATLFGGVAIIMFISSKLTLFMMGTFPILVLAALFFGRFIRKLSKERQNELASTNIVVEETLQAIKVVKAFANEGLEVLRYRKALDKTVSVALKASLYRAAFVSFIIFAIFGGIVLVLWYGSNLVASGDLLVGELTSFIIYTLFIGGAVGGLGDLYSQVQKTLGSSERILEILDESQEKDLLAPASTTPFKKFDGSIEFRNVSFSYPSRPEVTVLDKINLKIGKGEKVALVGPSGAGKSTVAQLILHFYDEFSGDIMIDGRPLRSFGIDELRKNIGIVPQETILFGGSIKENILYGKPEASFDEVKEAARQANALNFIDNFPDKFDTIVGERGIQLSGGQRQRIALARAILKDPAILVLDEATSSLDAESERLVQEALDVLMEGRSSLIIAHRLSTVKKADNILVINDGKIAEAGSHEALLLNESGLYTQLVKMQLS